MARFGNFKEDLIDWLITYIKGSPEDINKWQKQGVLSVLADDSKRQNLLTELCEIYFSFVTTRLRIGEDFKKEGELALGSISKLDIYKAYSQGFTKPIANVDHRKYRKSQLFKEITQALGARYHYLRLSQKNRLLSYGMLDQFCAPLSSCNYKGKRKVHQLELRMFFKHAENFVFIEAIPTITGSYEAMKKLHPDWIPISASDDMAKKYYNKRTCAGIFHIIKKYWLDTSEICSEYGIQEGSYSIKNRYIKNRQYQKEAAEEENEIMDHNLRQMKAGLPTAIQKCVRPGHIMLLDNGLLLWALGKMNAFGLFTDESGQLLEPDIFDRKNVPEFSEIDPLLSRLSQTYDEFYHELMHNTRSGHFKELHEHTCDIFGNDTEIHRNKHEIRAPKLYGGDIAVKIKNYSSSMPQILDMYLWKYRRDYYCGFMNDTFRYLCLPIDKHGFINPKHNSIYKPEFESFEMAQ